MEIAEEANLTLPPKLAATILIAAAAVVQERRFGRPAEVEARAGCQHGYCDHFTASAMTTKPVVVQQLSLTILVPAFSVNMPSDCHEPPLVCWFL